MKSEILRKLKRLNDKETIIKIANEQRIVERIPTGSLTLDAAIGGGWPIGRIVTLWGAKGSTKSTLALHSIKNAQAMGKQALYIDAERSFDATWAERIGVDTSELLVYQEVDVDKMIEKLSKDDFFADVDVCVIDSISVIYSDSVLQGNSAALGLQARATKRLINILAYLNPNALIIVISQQSNVSAGPMLLMPHWTGGNALDHHSSLIIGLGASKKDQIFSEQAGLETPVGQAIRWRVDKTKISQPFVSGQYDFMFGGLIDQRGELIELALRRGIIDKTGNWLEYQGKKYNGVKNLVEALEDAELFRGLKDEIFE